MTNTAFAIIHISYDSNAGLTGIQQTKFQLTNSRYAPGDCLLDYLTNDVYGAAIPLAQVDTASLTALNTYCAGSFSYTNANGNPATQARFRYDGVLDTARSIMDNMQDMASSCDCLLKYNEIQGKWGVITQSPVYTIAMDLNDSNMVSSIQISPLDIAGSYNVIECKFPDNSNQDAFNSSTFDLAQIDPTLLYPNEPVNKQSVSLPLVNNDVRAQYIATRMLKASREDLQVQVTVNFEGIQLEAGDIVTITNANYGWVAKEFRVMKITEDFESNGAVTAKLILSEFTASIYDDAPITQFQPSSNTGIGNPLIFGTVPPPTIGASYPSNANPLFLVNITASSAGIIQYGELWYSAFSNPTTTQLIFAGTTEVQSNGTPYNPGVALPAVSLSNIPAGTWYFFSRMVNSLGTSSFSLASAPFVWKPTTFQYAERYLRVAYADNATGTSNFSLSPTNRLYYGLYNTDSSSSSPTPSQYTWYLADPAFSTNKFVCYANRTGRRFSFDTGFAANAAGTGAFVPTQAIIFDPRLWSALPNGSNTIDLDMATGQVLSTGTTTTGTGEIEVTNNPDGKVVASLKQYLDFGSGIYQKTASAATLTIDIYGRVVGFEEPDAFYMTIESFTATSGQTVFNVTRSAGYISGQCLVFQNGILQSTADYADTGGTTGTVTFTTGRTAGVGITIISFKSSNTTTGVYASFTRNTATLTNASSYTPSGFSITSGYEFMFLNGSVMTEQDYDIVGGVITNFPSVASGVLTVIEWTPNNLTTPNGDPVNILINTIIGQVSYPFSYATGGFNLYENGVLLLQGTDYTTVSGGYSLTNTPTNNNSLLLQQTFARTGAV
jgi:Putative phage tail protein